MHVSPLMQQALKASANAPDKSLRRTRGGYVAPGTSTPVFTKRLVNMMDRAYLVRLHGEFGERAELTGKGAELVQL